MTPDPHWILLQWLQTFSPEDLQNEGEVETKFILPLFRHLGYPEACRRDKYPVILSRRPEAGARRKNQTYYADQVYFADEGKGQQNAASCLIVVEAKGPEVTNLDEAREQAHSYGEHLKPLFLVATNGHRLMILERRSHSDDSVLHDWSIEQLRQPEQASILYEHFHFDQLKHLKAQFADDLNHSQHIAFFQALKRHPDLQAEIEKGDFIPTRIQDGKHLTVRTPKVSISCELPLAFGEGNCRIEFSNLLLRRLTCDLTHQQILGTLMTGLQTKPNWRTRRFLEQAHGGLWKATLGQTTVLIDEEEVRDLCTCVDDVCLTYKAILLDIEDALETWEYRLVATEDSYGFYLLSVKQWLWHMMKHFSQEFAANRGDSKWHMFEPSVVNIQVCQKHVWRHQVILSPKYDEFADPGEPQQYIDLLYMSYEGRVNLYEQQGYTSTWKQSVGPHGLWTARYTKYWLVNQFIPTVLGYYNERPLQGTTLWQFIRDQAARRLAPHIFNQYKASLQRLQHEQENAVDDLWPNEEYPALMQVNQPKQFMKYLDRIQSWFNGYSPGLIEVALLRPYCMALTELAKRTDPATLNLPYIKAKLHNVAAWLQDQQGQTVDGRVFASYQDILVFLESYIAYIQNLEYEESDRADDLSRAFLAVLRDGTIEFSQEQLNRAKEAILPLWELCRFERRYIIPNR